jgi:uncharacterized protein YeeX (DUF496 family)
MRVEKFNPMFHNVVRLYLEDKWDRKLTDHEKHLVAEVHDYVRTAMEVEEIKIVEDISFRPIREQE